MERCDPQCAVQSAGFSLSCAWLQLLQSHGHGDRVSNDLELSPVHADCFSTCSMRRFQDLDSTEPYTHSSHVQCESWLEPVASCWPGTSAGRGISSSLDLSCLPQCRGMAALHEAVLTGNLDCVKLLVKYGADIHQRDENGWTPLHMACSDGHADIARYLISLGASPEATTDSGEKPSDLIDPEYQDLVELFGATTMG
ncbi:protein phosphatase 1 regulatory subunit 27 isoform 1-T1 [Guaruba guarouba]